MHMRGQLPLRIWAISLMVDLLYHSAQATCRANGEYTDTSTRVIRDDYVGAQAICCHMAWMVALCQLPVQERQCSSLIVIRIRTNRAFAIAVLVHRLQVLPIGAQGKERRVIGHRSAHQRRRTRCHVKIIHVNAFTFTVVGIRTDYQVNMLGEYHKWGSN